MPKTNALFTAPLAESEDNGLVQEVSRIILQKTGVQLGEKHAAMIHSRLLKRMTELGNLTPAAYLDHIHKNVESESSYLLSLLTTHHTFFFRESAHFDHLEEKALPELVAHLVKSGVREIKVLSAACSRGQEVYSLAMHLDRVLAEIAPQVKFKVLGIDVDPDSVKICQNGVYRWEEVKEIPATLLNANWVRGTGEIADYVKAKKTLRDHCDFRVGNLLDLKPALANEQFHIIFCRNVFIYFSPEQVKKSSEELIRHLDSKGYFYIGLSESLVALKTGVKLVGPSVYHREDKRNPPLAAVATGTTRPSPSAIPAPAAQPARALRVLCVDDSVTVLTLLKKVLTYELGFEVVGTAKDGLEAAQKVKETKPDLMTLDIHMPNQTGIEYLQKNFGPGHPPVLMVTSVSREDMALGQDAIRLGASDYVEKPTLQNLALKADEIRSKLRAAFRAKGAPAATSALDKSFSTNRSGVREPRGLRVLVVDSKNLARAEPLVHGAFREIDSPFFIVTQSSTEAEEMRKRHAGARKCSDGFPSPQATGISKGLLFIDTISEMSKVLGQFQTERSWSFCFMFIGMPFTLTSPPPPALLALVSDKGRAEGIIEDTVDNWLGVSVHRIPITSFAYHAEDFLRKKGGNL